MAMYSARRASSNPASRVRPQKQKLDAFDAQQISTPAHSIMVHIGNVSSELMVQIKQKGVYEVETPPPTSFLGGSSVLGHDDIKCWSWSWSIFNCLRLGVCNICMWQCGCIPHQSVAEYILKFVLHYLKIWLSKRISPFHE